MDREKNGPDADKGTIRLNVLDPTLDRRALSQDIGVVELSVTDFKGEGWDKAFARLIRAVRGQGAVPLALRDRDLCRGTPGPTVLVGVRAGQDLYEFVEAVRGEVPDVVRGPRDIWSVSDRGLLALLLANLSGCAGKGLFSNPLGELLYSSGGMAKGKGAGRGPKYKVAVSVQVDPRMCLQFRVVTFTQKLYVRQALGKNPPEKERAALNRLVGYALDGTSVVLADPNERDESKIYVRKRPKWDTKRSRVDFMGLDAETFEGSKARVYEALTDAMDAAYGDAARLSLRMEREVLVSGWREGPRATPVDAARGLVCAVVALDPGCEGVADALRAQLREHGHLAPGPSPESPLLAVLHDKGYYAESGLDDPYGSVPPCLAVQHVTAETVRGAGPGSPLGDALSVSLKELAIKCDLVRGRIPRCPEELRRVFLPEWGWERGKGEKRRRVLAGLDCLEVAGSRIAYAHVPADGLLEAGRACAAAWFAAEEEIEKGAAAALEALIEDAEGDLYLIWSTGVFAMPEGLEGPRRLSDIAESRRLRSQRDESYRNRTGSFRSKEDYPLFDDLMGTRLFRLGEDPGSWYYTVGYRNAPKWRYACGVPARRLRRQDGTDFDPGWILDMLEVGFVRNKMPTVLPYPVKYLREARLLFGPPVPEEEEGDPGDPEAT